MKKPIFTFEDINDEVIVLKVNCNSPLEAAKNPYVDMTYDYISLTRGRDHILTVVDKQGKSWSIDFGISGHTLVDDRTTLLKNKVLDFLNENHILVEYRGEPLREARVFYNHNYGQWQLSMDKCLNSSTSISTHYMSKTATSAEELIKECKCIVDAKNWVKGTAQTGIDIWRATAPKFKIVDHEKKLLKQNEKDKSIEKGTKTKEPDR